MELVKEKLDFERGIGPRRSLGVGGFYGKAPSEFTFQDILEELGYEKGDNYKITTSIGVIRYFTKYYIGDKEIFVSIASKNHLIHFFDRDINSAGNYYLEKDTTPKEALMHIDSIIKEIKND